MLLYPNDENNLHLPKIKIAIYKKKKKNRYFLTEAKFTLQFISKNYLSSNATIIVEWSKLNFVFFLN